MFYSGHGEIGHIKLIDFNLEYFDAVKHILDAANTRINAIAKSEKTFNLRYESGWFINWYLDACHSGSCKDETEKWLVDHMECAVIEEEENLLEFTQRKEGKGGIVIRKTKNFSKCHLKFFNRAAYAQFTIFTSCKSDEVSQDAGEGKGSTWTNFYIAKGVMNPSYGFKFKCKDAKGKEQTQTTQVI